MTKKPILPDSMNFSAAGGSRSSDARKHSALEMPHIGNVLLENKNGPSVASADSCRRFHAADQPRSSVLFLKQAFACVSAQIIRLKYQRYYYAAIVTKAFPSLFSLFSTSGTFGPGRTYLVDFLSKSESLLH